MHILKTKVIYIYWFSFCLFVFFFFNTVFKVKLSWNILHLKKIYYMHTLKTKVNFSKHNFFLDPDKSFIPSSMHNTPTICMSFKCIFDATILFQNLSFLSTDISGNFLEVPNLNWKWIFKITEFFFHTDISHTKGLGHLKLVCLNCMVSFIELIVIKISLIITKLDLNKDQGPVIQSIVSLTSSLRLSSLRVISFTVLADSIYNILIFFAEKMWVAAKATHIFSAKNFSIFVYHSM